MATKSILKTININNRNACRNFVKALERAEKVSCRKKEFSNPNNFTCREVKGEEIKELFK